jgi:TPR repeat protein
VDQDLDEAKHWLLKAAAQGHTGARVKLAGFDDMMLRCGPGAVA